MTENERVALHSLLRDAWGPITEDLGRALLRTQAAVRWDARRRANEVRAPQEAGARRRPSAPLPRGPRSAREPSLRSNRSNSRPADAPAPHRERKRLDPRSRGSDGR